MGLFPRQSSPASQEFSLRFTSALPLTLLIAIALSVAATSASAADPNDWVAAQDGQVPRGAVLGGSAGTPPANLYICRARYGNGVHPGKIVGKHCNIGWGGKEVLLSRYEVMTERGGLRFHWIDARNGAVPRGAVPGGDEGGRPLYVCRASYQNGMHPGKLFGSFCNIGWGGREVTVSEYQVMVSVGPVEAPPNRQPAPPPVATRPPPPPVLHVPQAQQPSAPAPAVAGRIGWVPVRDGRVPNEAVSGGEVDGTPFHVCRAPHGGGLHPGKQFKGVCYVGWGGKEIGFREYEVMIESGGPPLRWIDARSGSVPSGAIVGGNEGSQPLYVCRANYRNSMHPGKLVGQNCNIGLGGKELTYPDYQVLVGIQTEAPPPTVAQSSPPPAPAAVPSVQSPAASAQQQPAAPPQPGLPKTGAATGPAATRSFALANRTRSDVNIFRGSHESNRLYVGTLASGHIFSSEAPVGEMYYFSQDDRWIGAYRIDARARRQLIELPSLQVYGVN